MWETVVVSVSRTRAPALPATVSSRSFPPGAVSLMVRAPPGTGNVVSSFRASRSRRFGGSSATPCETIVRAKTTGPPPAPPNGRAATPIPSVFPKEPREGRKHPDREGGRLPPLADPCPPPLRPPRREVCENQTDNRIRSPRCRVEQVKKGVPKWTREAAEPGWPRTTRQLTPPSS